MTDEQLRASAEKYVYCRMSPHTVFLQCGALMCADEAHQQIDILVNYGRQVRRETLIAVGKRIHEKFGRSVRVVDLIDFILNVAEG